MAIGTYALLELTPKGRNEERNLMDWVRHHDRYDDARHATHGCCAEMPFSR
jgi:predicted dithiol-disulfide oxidoreductase (DUF899 family)